MFSRFYTMNLEIFLSLGADCSCLSFGVLICSFDMRYFVSSCAVLFLPFAFSIIGLLRAIWIFKVVVSHGVSATIIDCFLLAIVSWTLTLVELLQFDKNLVGRFLLLHHWCWVLVLVIRILFKFKYDWWCLLGSDLMESKSRCQLLGPLYICVFTFAANDIVSCY